MTSGNIAMLELATEHLGVLAEDVVFVGGATIGLWITDPAAPEARATNDVDVIVEVSSRAAFQQFEERVRTAGFRNDQEGGVICRFRHGTSGLILDLIPTEPSILGFSNRWLVEAYPNAVEHELPSGRVINAISPPYLLATKLEAFGARGGGDFHGSRDFEDVIALIDGREELAGELARAHEPVRAYIAGGLATLRQLPGFRDGVDGALPFGAGGSERVDSVVLPRIERILALG